jgi:hypothetical protein
MSKRRFMLLLDNGRARFRQIAWRSGLLSRDRGGRHPLHRETAWENCDRAEVLMGLHTGPDALKEVSQ